MQTVLHINDNNLLLQSKTVQSVGQGYAWLKGDEVVFDTDASASPVRHCRLSPQEINNRYWQFCDQSALPDNDAGMRHTGDLIWKHLNALNDAHDLSEIVLAVPSHYHEANLQLLLGIANSCGVAVRAMVNKAVLAMHALTSTDGNYVHIDLQLHQLVVSRLACRQGQLRLVDVDVFTDVGMHLMQESLLKGLQTRFIQSDRFDPLHDAETEQQLFDQLADVAKQIVGAGKANVAVEHNGKLHSTTIEAVEWNALLEPFTQRILDIAAQAGAVTVCLDLNALFDNAIPPQFGGGQVKVVQQPGSIPASLTALIDDDDPGFITELPCSTTTSATKPTEVDQQPSSTSHATAVVAGAATHILLAGEAVSLGRAHIAAKANNLVVRQGEPNVAQLLAKGSLYILNDESRKQLQPNDRLASHIADGVLMAIQVLE